MIKEINSFPICALVETFIDVSEYRWGHFLVIFLYEILLISFVSSVSLKYLFQLCYPLTTMSSGGWHRCLFDWWGQHPVLVFISSTPVLIHVRRGKSLNGNGWKISMWISEDCKTFKIHLELMFSTGPTAWFHSLIKIDKSVSFYDKVTSLADLRETSRLGGSEFYQSFWYCLSQCPSG